MTSEKFYTYREDDQHFTVVDSDDTPLGSVTEVEDGWRAYDTAGNELPGAQVYASQHLAGEALAANLEGDNDEGS